MTEKKSDEIDRFLRCQTIEVGDKVPGETRARRSAKFPEIVSTVPGVLTAYDLYKKGVTECPNSEYLGTREFLPDGKRGAYKWMTYGEAEARYIHIGAALVQLGRQKGDRIGIFSINRTEWILVDAGLHTQALVPVALYATLGHNAVEFVVNHADISVIFCDGKNLDKCLSLKNCPQMTEVVCFDRITPEQKEKAAANNVHLQTLDELEALGKVHPSPPNPPSSEDLFTIMYTSGSTGNPKGVMLTQRNLVAELSAVSTHNVNISKEEVHISYLPLAHSFERLIVSAMTLVGAKVGFFGGAIPELFNDIQELRPTVLIGAPRVWQRLHDKMWSTINNESWLKRTLFNLGVSSKMSALKKGGTTPIWDTILFSQTKNKLGGRVRFILSGSAPLDPKLADFLRACFCCPILQGYGLTENFAGAVITDLHDPTIGHTGYPVACNEIKLVDIPEMNYYATDTPCARGEVCIRGGNLFKGYFKDPEKTAEDLKEDGWFHTGDVGQWNPNGTLSIIDRKKNIFKLSQGEYVAAEYLEGIFVRSPYITQVFVYGDSLNSFLVAVVVPDWDNLTPAAKTLDVKGTNAEIAKDPKINELILKNMGEIGKQANLHGFEYPKVIYVESNAFSEEQELITPTFKLRRPNLKNFYQNLITDMYTEYKKAHPDA